jgi:hypothetical protein
MEFFLRLPFLLPRSIIRFNMNLAHFGNSVVLHLFM